MFGMPVEQINAHLGDDMMMRVGLPNKGGRLTFHAFNEGYPVMVSASAFWNPATSCFQIPDACNLHELDLALDSAGFTAMKLWKAKGAQPGIANVFPWRLEQYVELASLMGVSWWSQPDLCCEPEIASSQAEIDYRIDATATLLEGTLRMVYEWQNALARSCTATVVANMIKPPVPVLQGWSSGDYLRSLDLMMQVWERWQPWLAAPALIGVGSMCRRTLKHPTHGLHAILASLEGQLPAKSRLHLFGVKGGCLSELKMLDFVASADSMAYDFGARVKAHRAGRSNTVAHRSAEMTRWMSAAAQRIKPACGDQFRLELFA
ncbi:hypothetical protein D9M73_74540 [compost metagenome]